MSPLQIAPEVVNFYSNVIDEGIRLTSSADGRLEFIRTQELLRRFLPTAPARILDVGGGTGIHARWLVEDGYHVELVDAIERHVIQAAKVCPATVGDARHLEAADASYDAVHLLGPLYHLPDPTDRAQALSEAVRVTRRGGTVAAAAINRYSSLFEHTAFEHLHKERVTKSIARILETSIHDGRGGFTLAYFHRAEELAEELRDSGLTNVQVFGIEGPAWSQLKAVEQHPGVEAVSDDLFNSVLTAARLAEPYPELLAASSHLLAVGTVPA